MDYAHFVQGIKFITISQRNVNAHWENLNLELNAMIHAKQISSLMPTMFVTVVQLMKLLLMVDVFANLII
jgi:hypothetical protein